jgi:hypothetical protein
MAKKKTKKEADKEALSRVRKEMAAPRMSNSVHEQETKQLAAAARDGSA